LIEGEDIVRAEGAHRQAILRRFGVMYQHGALFGSMTLLENVRFPLEMFTHLGDRAIDLIARTKLDLVQLSGSENCSPQNCPVACASARPSRARWRSIPRSCSWTSPPRASIRLHRPRSINSSCASRAAWA